MAKEQISILIALCLFFAGFATGCWNEAILEQVGVILIASIDQLPNGRIRLADAAPVIDPNAEDRIEIVMTEGTTIRECREVLNRKTGRELVGGKIQSLVFGEATAQQGIRPHMEIFARDPVNPLLAWVVVAEGEGSVLLQKGVTMEDKPAIGIYISELLENNANTGQTVRTLVYQFETAFYTPGIDPVTPMIRASETEMVVIGSALFDSDRMCGRLDNTQSLMLNLLMGKKIDGRLSLKMPESLKASKHYVTIQIVQSKRKIQKSLKQGLPSFLIELAMEVNIEEAGTTKLLEPEFLKKMEQFLSDSLTDHLQKTIRLIQEAGCDAIGTGLIAKASWFKQWQQWDWKKLYPKIDLKASAKVNIRNSGAIS